MGLIKSVGRGMHILFPLIKIRCLISNYASHCKELGLLGSVALPFFESLKFTYYLIILVNKKFLQIKKRNTGIV